MLQQKHRGLLWLTFWLLFLGTPCTPLLAGLMNRFMPIRIIPLSQLQTIILSIGGGTLGAGFVLAKLYSQSTSQLIKRGLLFGLAIGIFYAVVFFAGCMLIMSKVRM